MKKVRLTALVMTVIMLIAVMAACSDNTPKTTGKNTGAKTTAEQKTTAEIDKDSYEYAKSLIPDVKYDREYRVLTSTVATSFDPNTPYYSRNVFAEEALEVPINDNILERNNYLKEKLGITIVSKAEKTPTEALRTSCKSNLDTYDAAYIPMGDAATLATEKYLVDLYEINGLNLDEIWWDQSAIKDLSIGGKLYFTASDGDVIDKQCTWGTMFNKKVLQDANLDEPYQLVIDHQWTSDKYVEYAKTVKDDLNGDGNYDANDQWGIVTECNSIVGFFFGFDGRIADKDSDDLPEISMNSSSRYSDAIERAFEIVLNPETTICCENMKNVPGGISVWLHASNMFTNNQTLFRSCDINTVERWRAMEADFGIIPMPLLDEEQENYSCGVATNTGTCVCVPSSCEDLDFVGVCLEAFTATSRYTLREGYYETTLGGILSRDSETRIMLDLIFATRRFDLGYIYNWGGLGQILRTMGLANNTNFSSEYDKVSGTAETARETTLKAFDLM